MPFGFGKPSVEKMKSRKDISGLSEALSAHDPTVRRSAAEALGAVGDASAVDRLIAALEDRNETVRDSVAEALCEIGSIKAVRALCSAGNVTGLRAALKNSKSETRLNAVEALAHMHPAYHSGVEDAIACAATDQDPTVRKRAITAIVEMDLAFSTKLLDTVLFAIGDSESRVRVNAVMALGRIGEYSPYDRPRIEEGLLVALKDPDAVVRFTAAIALGTFGNENAVSELCSACKCPDWKQRERAAYLLGKFGNSQAIDALICVLKDNNSALAKEAVKALGNTNNPKAIEALIELLSNETLKDETAKALAKINSPEAVDALRAQFLGVLTDVQKTEISNLPPEVYRLMVKEKQGEKMPEIILADDLNAIAVIRKLKIEELERLALSVEATIEADKLSQVNLSKAACYYQEAIKNNPFNDIALMSYGCVLASQGNLREGIKWVERAIDVNPKNDRAKRNLKIMWRDL